ncbi:hypothetical protein O3M35_001504 [Rhynocoris fuscipes]|uniref:Uncharacterized protein n=1 Tax=Rhynocoris fuscipes TaxID=488301 RepID=A0AAW1CRT9_9HEMI
MENILSFVIGILVAVFIGSFIILILLCRYKTIRKRTATYMKRLARSELNHSDMELIDKSSKRNNWKFFTSQSKDIGQDRIEARCEALLSICNSINLSAHDVSSTDLDKLYQIIQVSRNITEEANCNGNKEDTGLLERRTTKLLNDVSRALRKMEHQLSEMNKITVPDDFTNYHSTIII